jgi:hypothetical protein
MSDLSGVVDFLLRGIGLHVDSTRVGYAYHRGRVVNRLKVLTALIALSISGLAATPAQALVDLTRSSRPHVIPEWGERPTGIPLCTSERDLDCVEGLRVRSGNRWQEAVLLSEEVTETFDEGLGPGTAASLTWQYESVTEGRVVLDLSTVMSPRGTTRFGKDALDHGIFLAVHRRSDEHNPWPGLGDLDCSTGNVQTCLLGVRLPERDVFEVTVRTSWLRSNGVGIFGLDPQVASRSMKGGTRWSFSARQVLVPKPRRWDETTPAQGWVPHLSFQVDHAGDGLHDSAFDPRCAAFGAPWSTPNAAGAGRLRWRTNQDSLDFQVFSPHLDPHGNPYRGNFTAGIPIKWLNCIAEKDLRPAYFSVEVVSENGEEQVATTTLRVHRGMVYVRAVGFTFSKPTVRLSTKG